jgi:PAS domain S-box-containing protein
MSIADMIETSPIAAVISDPRRPDNPIVACNNAFAQLTGYPKGEVIGRNCRFLAGDGTEAELTDRLRGAISRKQPIMVEILNYKKDGTPFRNAVMVVPIFDDSGAIEYFLGSQIEVAEGAPGSETPRKLATDRVANLTRRQKEILIQMASGKLNKQIAFELGLSERTIKMHRSAVFKGLGVKTSADAIRIAIEAGY